LVDGRKQAKLQRLQDPSEVNEDNLNEVGQEDSTHLKNKKREYLKDKIKEFGSNNKYKNTGDLYRGISECKKGYQPRTNLLKDERDGLLAETHKISNRWKNYFCQLLNVHRVDGVKQTKMHTTEPSVPESSASEVEVAIGKLKRYKSPGVDQIPSEMIQIGGETLPSEIHKLIKLIWKKTNCVTSGKSQMWYLSTRRLVRWTVVITGAYHCCQLHTKFYRTFFSLGQPHMQMKLLRTTNVSFDVTDQRLVKFSISSRYWRKNENIMVQYISYS
jgi:hypothetical protein